MGDPNISREMAGGRGKLVAHWYNLRRKMKKVQILGKKGSKPALLDTNSTVNTDESDDAILWLQNNKHPWMDVLDKWKKTTKGRISLLMSRNISVHDYMDKYPALKDGNGFVLYDADFAVLFPGAELKLFSEWPSLSAFILDRIPAKEKEEIEESLTPDSKRVRTLVAITSIFPVVTAVMKSKKLQWRPSRIESKEGLIQFVKTEGDIQTAMNIRREKYEKYGVSLGPQAIVVGYDEDSITECYVLINKVMYNVENPLKAVDVVFKAMHALDTPYPAECKREWLFLQLAVYGIQTPHDKQSLDGKTSNIINDYRKFTE